jgi:integrase
MRRRAEQRSGAPGPDAGGQTLQDFVTAIWAPRARRRLAEKTWQRDTVVLEKHILSRLGDRPIAEVDSEALVEWQDQLELTGVGAPTIIKAIGILSSVFREAARRPRLTGVNANPVVLLERPSAKRRRRPLVWGPVVVERVRLQLLVHSRRINPARELMARRDALLVALMEMTGCRPGEALALRWSDVDGRVVIARAVSGGRIVDRTKSGKDRVAPLPAPLAADLDALRRFSGAAADEHVFRPAGRQHWVETDWRNFRVRHFVPALRRVEAEWEGWRQGLPDPAAVRESVAGLSTTRPYDLGRHTHSALMLASGMSLHRLARIQGHGMRVLDQAYSEELAEFQDRSERIDPVAEIAAARALVWGPLDPSTGRGQGS